MKILTIAKKELISFFRDKSTVIILVIPILIFPVYNAGIKYICEGNKGETKICFVSDSEIANMAFDNFKRSDVGYSVKEVASNNENKLLSEGKIDCIIRAEKNDIDFICNSKSYNSMSKALKVGEKFQQYFYSQVGNNKIIYNFNLKNELYQIIEPTNSITKAVTPVILVVFCFQSILGFSNDVFSGEKERKTLELLYLSDVSKKDIYWGKISALTIISVLNTLICVVTYIFSSKATLADIGKIFYMLVILSELSIISVSISSTVSLRMNSIKASQTINELILSIPLVSTAILSFGFINQSGTIIHFIPMINLECDLSNIFLNDFNPKALLCDLPINVIFIVVISFANIEYMKSEKVFR